MATRSFLIRNVWPARLPLRRWRAGSGCTGLLNNGCPHRFQFFLDLAKAYRDVHPGEDTEVFDEHLKAAFGKGEFPDRVDPLNSLPPEAGLFFHKADVHQLVDVLFGIRVAGVDPGRDLVISFGSRSITLRILSRTGLERTSRYSDNSSMNSESVETLTVFLSATIKRPPIVRAHPGAVGMLYNTIIAGNKIGWHFC